MPFQCLLLQLFWLCGAVDGSRFGLPDSSFVDDKCLDLVSAKGQIDSPAPHVPCW
jgi:hypothetical protein